MGYNIFHVLEEGWPNGCCSQIEHFNAALERHFPDHKSHVILLHNKTSKWFNLDYEHFPLNSIIKHIKDHDRPVVLLHRILRSDTKKYGFKLYRKHLYPLFIVNHTFHPSPNPIGRCDGVICVSKHMQEHYQRKFSDTRIHFIRNGVNQFMYDDIKITPSECSDSDVFRAGRISAFNSYKYSQKFHDWVMTEKFPKPLLYEWIGDGISFKEAKRHNKSSRKRNAKVCNHVQFLGPIYNHHRKVGILKSWDITLYDVNQHEGTSMSVLESLACGIPVICSEHYGTCEFIENGANGYVYSKLDPYARRIIRNLMNNPQELVGLKQKTAAHFAEHLDAKIMVQNYLKLFDKTYRKQFGKKNK